MVVSRSPSGMPPHAVQLIRHRTMFLLHANAGAGAQLATAAAAAAAACRPASQARHYSAPALQLLLLCIKLEEMENVESVSLPADVTYTMTASGGRSPACRGCQLAVAFLLGAAEACTLLETDVLNCR